MARPCPHPDKSLPAIGAAYVKGACRVCWLFVNDRKARRKWDARPAVKPTPVRKTLCRHLGDAVSIDFKKQNGLELSRHWSLCELGLMKNKPGVPGIVCACEGCGPKCEKYEGESE